MTVQVGSVLLNSMVGGGWSIDFNAGGRPNETGGPGWGVVVLAGSRGYPVVLSTRGGLHFGVDIIHLGADVLGHVLGGGALVDEGVDDGGDEAFGVGRGRAGSQVQGRSCVSTRGSNNT